MNTLARTTDPETSQEAGSVADTQRSAQAVLAALRHLGPSTDHRLVAHLKETSVWSESRIRTARSALVREGLVEFTGQFYVPASGRRSRIWTVAA